MLWVKQLLGWEVMCDREGTVMEAQGIWSHSICSREAKGDDRWSPACFPPFSSASSSSPWMLPPALRWIFTPPQHPWKHLCRYKGSVSFMIPNPVTCRDIAIVSVESPNDSTWCHTKTPVLLLAPGQIHEMRFNYTDTAKVKSLWPAPTVHRHTPVYQC